MSNAVLENTETDYCQLENADAVQRWQEIAEAEANSMRTLSTDEQLEVLDSIEAQKKTKVRKAFERGMATAEYAVGILAAVALALVLLKIITGKDFFSAMLKFVISLITKVGAQLP